MSEPIEICDPTGKVIGHFLPNQNTRQFEPAEPDISEEELSRRSKARAKGSTTEEMMKRLETL